jgi:methylated-DNA-[protein]-cysteine S-methyltransferase
MPAPQTFTRLATPIGELTLTASNTALTAVYFPTSKHGPPPADRAEWIADDGRGPAGEILERVRHQLSEYFAGTRQAFDVPLAAPGSVFEHRVWEALRAIPYGVTTSYGALARRLGDPRATRAVAAANAKNPIPIIVPCHRVLGARGELTGFGGGLDRKRWLLEHEGALLPLRG